MNGLSNKKIIFKFEPVVPEISEIFVGDNINLVDFPTDNLDFFIRNVLLKLLKTEHLFLIDDLSIKYGHFLCCQWFLKIISAHLTNILSNS